MNSETCSISFDLIDKNVARINAFFVSIILIFSIICPNYITPIFLLIDFFFRAFLKKWFVLSFLSEKVINFAKLKKKTTNAASKYFAAKIWFLMSLLILISFFFSTLAYWILAWIFLIFSWLDLFLDFCMWCFIYNNIISKIKK